ncbi:TPA: hypothetical protein ACPJ2I_001534 [Vibrio alginolyticus]|uniref:hypothetical protein n=1 Tax=Vibrio alginolyticus TaxID=663 RepID=UPI00202315B8|nr:hypothetical protein [Vibrio alginolyticus]MCR9958675.1 hypothetical protein [Vibrio alginolyticus]
MTKMQTNVSPQRAKCLKSIASLKLLALQSVSELNSMIGMIAMSSGKSTLGK